jgi:hypothetical protein
VKLLRSEKGKFVFHLGQREGRLLLALLQRYPLIPSAYQPLSKTPGVAADNTDQHLLDQALAEQRLENQRHLQALLRDKRRFKKVENGCRLILTGGDVEWLLQVLNDVRVGSWIILGAPEKDLWDFALNESTAPHAWAMEMAGLYQARLLDALSPDPSH